MELAPRRSACDRSGLDRPVLQRLHARALIETVHAAARRGLGVEPHDVLQSLGELRVVAIEPTAVAVQTQFGHLEPLPRCLGR